MFNVSASLVDEQTVLLRETSQRAGHSCSYAAAGHAFVDCDPTCTSTVFELFSQLVRKLCCSKHGCATAQLSDVFVVEQSQGAK